MRLVSSSSLFSGLPVRHLIQSISYQATSIDEEIALGLVFETNQNTLHARESSHLTNATPSDHQIRFPLKDRIKRSIVKLANQIAKRLPANEVLFVSLDDDDYLSQEFFKELSYRRIGTKNADEAFPPSEFLLQSEKRLEKLLQEPQTHFNDILKKCSERLYAGDYRAVYKILGCLPDHLKTDDVYYMLGLCTNFFERFEESENYFQQGLNSANPYSKIRSSYVMSMLYLRMHKKEKQSLEVAEELLQNAHAVLLKHQDIPDWTFHSVFNRNGYALCLYRRGQIEQALELLEAGIETLQYKQDGAYRLHKSVLIYNAVQCLRTLRRYEECENKCHELLEIDPYFPEYHLEQARSSLEQGKIAEGLAAVQSAIEIDDFIPEAFALQGFGYLQLENLPAAIKAYQQAVRLSPYDTRLKLDLGYCLSELNRNYELKELLNSVNPNSLDAFDREGYEALCAEVAS